MSRSVVQSLAVVAAGCLLTGCATASVAAGSGVSTARTDVAHTDYGYTATLTAAGTQCVALTFAGGPGVAGTMPAVFPQGTTRDGDTLGMGGATLRDGQQLSLGGTAISADELRRLDVAFAPGCDGQARYFLVTSASTSATSGSAAPSR